MTTYSIYEAAAKLGISVPCFAGKSTRRNSRGASLVAVSTSWTRILKTM